MSLCEQFYVVYRIVNVCDCIFHFFLERMKGSITLIRFSEVSVFLKVLRAIDLELSQSGDLYLVISIITNKKKLKGKNFSFTNAHCYSLRPCYEPESVLGSGCGP